MSHTKKLILNTYSTDDAIRAGNFRLLPENPSLPLIVSQPIKNFTQFTWIRSYKNDMPVLQEIAINNNTVNMLEGTEFGLSFKTIDPSNINDVNDTTSLSYQWKKDGALLYQLNALNGGVGVNSFLVSARDGRAELSGKYTCEITNQYGTVETEQVIVNIIDPLKHPKLFKNLILNGDGEGGLNGWQGTDIKVNPFINNVMVTQNFGSTRLAGLVSYEVVSWMDGISNDTKTTSPEFYFSMGSHDGLFFPKFWKAWTEDATNFRNINIKQKSPALSEGEWWLLAGITPQIVLNEDYQKSNHAVFFPGPQWIDNYNKNNFVTGLTDELRDYTPTYFTRNKLKFEKFGGKQSTTMIQNINLNEAADFVDGNVYGVQYATSQFFAYVGAGITGYKITVQTTDGEKTFNYNIADTEDIFNHVFGNVSLDSNANKDVYNYESDLVELGKRYNLLLNSEIKITPIVDDVTTITLDFINDSGEILKTETIDGPDVTDVWAIKEKVYFPLTLYGIFEFLKPSGNNPITVFGQKYTDTTALAPFFVATGMTSTFTPIDFGVTFGSSLTPNTQPVTIAGTKGPLAEGINGTLSDYVRDINARFLLRKFPFKEKGGAYPREPYGVEKALQDKTSYRAVSDYGAAAMFGVGKTTIVPYKTRSVRVGVEFKHKSEVIRDVNPEGKGWTSQEIYLDDNGQSTGRSKRMIEYGTPRCAITKMKFILVPNDLGASYRYATFTIPPAESTVLGLQKKKYTNPNAFNTADSNVFNYELTLPEKLPNAPQPTDPFTKAKTEQEYLNSLGINKITQSPQPLLPDTMGSTDDIQAQEDADYNKGDYNQITGHEF